ncbi:hypothetical protein Aduo_001433 [Ancylostoma duodenale]
MTTKRGWNDNIIPRFASGAVLVEYSAGKTAAKPRGRRGIVISAVTNEGVVPGCTKVIVNGRGSIEEDMNHATFEDWLRECFLHMQHFAEGRTVSLIFDNAPYHSRQLEKIPNKSSTKVMIEGYLRSKGVEVSADSTKADLLVDLNDFIASRGGAAALRRYATEAICAEYGITKRIPGEVDSFHVTTRTLDWTERVPSTLCRGWFREIVREKDAAREKIVADRNNDIVEHGEDSTSYSSTEFLDSEEDSSEYDD